MKQKTQKKLERENRLYRGLVFWGWFVAVILTIFLIITTISPQINYRYRELKTQLSECQEQVPETKWRCPALLEKGKYSFKDGILTSPSGIEMECQEQVTSWTLEIECFNLRGRWIDQENYTKIDNCLHFRDVAKSWGCKIIENCEVIE